MFISTLSKWLGRHLFPSQPTAETEAATDPAPETDNEEEQPTTSLESGPVHSDASDEEEGEECMEEREEEFLETRSLTFADAVMELEVDPIPSPTSVNTDEDSGLSQCQMEAIRPKPGLHKHYYNGGSSKPSVSPLPTDTGQGEEGIPTGETPPDDPRPHSPSPTPLSKLSNITSMESSLVSTASTEYYSDQLSDEPLTTTAVKGVSTAINAVITAVSTGSQTPIEASHTVDLIGRVHCRRHIAPPTTEEFWLAANLYNSDGTGGELSATTTVVRPVEECCSEGIRPLREEAACMEASFEPGDEHILLMEAVCTVAEIGTDACAVTVASPTMTTSVIEWIEEGPSSEYLVDQALPESDTMEVTADIELPPEIDEDLSLSGTDSSYETVSESEGPLSEEDSSGDEA